jgi:hypothetical protein
MARHVSALHILQFVFQLTPRAIDLSSASLYSGAGAAVAQPAWEMTGIRHVPMFAE